MRGTRKRTAPRQKFTTSPLISADLAMFAKLKIPKALLDEGGVCRVTDTQARQLGIVGPSTHDMQGIAFPYLDQNTGDITTLRVRRDYPETKNGSPDGKYLCPKGASGLYIHPRSAAKL